MTFDLPPGLVLVAGGLLVPLLRGRAREGLVLLVPLLTLAATWMVPDGAVRTAGFLGQELVPVRGSDLGRIFATAFSLTAFGGGLFALRNARATELAAAYVYGGSAVGVVFAGDLITLFVFWEIMMIASTVVIWASDQPGAYGASMRFLLVHLFGGVVLMFGIAAHLAATGSVEFGPMDPDGLATWCILIGFLVNAGAPPLSAWIPDAYPEASASGMIFLSIFTTKTAVFALAVGFPGTALLIPVGLYMVAYGIFYALAENDMRRILAYMIVGSVGFMLVGIGIGSELAIAGVAAYAFASILYKTLLVMTAGTVLLATGRRRCTELGGLVRTMPFTAAAAVVGGLTLASFPLTSGFVSKALLTQAAGDAHATAAWFGLMAGSAGLFVAAGVAFPWFVFFGRDRGLRPDQLPGNVRVATGLFLAASVLPGLFPEALYSLLPGAVDYHAYTAAHVVAQLQLVLFAGLAFLMLGRLAERRAGTLLDWDWFYREWGPDAVGRAVESVAVLGGRLEAAVEARILRVIDRLFETHGPRGILARTWPTGSMVLWVGVLLAAFLLFYYV